MLTIPDIYYLENWSKLYAEKECGIPERFEMEIETGKIIYPFIKRKIDTKINNKTYYDIVTVYGFNGPIIIGKVENRKQAAEIFNQKFQEYCKNNNIIAEYIRFSPWFKNYLDFGEIYNLKLNKQTIFIDLTVNDVFMDEISSKRRNCIRSAIKKGVTIQFDFEGNTVEDFHKLYQNTISKNNISEYYQLSIDFLRRHFEILKGNVFIANAMFENKIISSSIFVHQDKQLHYLYSANDYAYTYLNGNSLILSEVANWGKANGKEKFHLGGATVSEDLRKFKLSFTKNEGLDYYVGNKIRQEKIYDELVKITNNENNTYFPKYRNG